MPALPAVLNVARISMRLTGDSDTDIINRFYINFLTAGGTSAQMTTAVTSIASAWNTDLAGQFHTNMALVEVVGEDLTSATSAVGVWTGSHAGTRGGASLAAGVAAVIRFEIARRYRGGHPRMYLSCFDSADIATAQTWNATSLTNLLTAWGTFIGAAQTALGVFSGGGSSQHCNVSYYHGFTPVLYPSGRYRNVPNLRATPLVDQVLSYAANPNVCSQRRRNQTP